MPIVSVIVPVYGVEKYIERCARSLFEQTLDDIEYLFIDDCTPDRSIEILNNVLEEYPQRKPQVVIHRMDQNSGQAAVREWGTRHATGDYIIHCDSDDWVNRSAYQELYEKAIESSADIVVCDYNVLNNDLKKYINGCNSIKKDVFINDLLNGKVSWVMWNKLVKRDLYQSRDIVFPKDNMAEDMAIVLQLVLKVDKVAYIPSSLYYYCSNPSSLTNNFSEKSVWEKYLQVYKNTEIVISVFKRANLHFQYDLSYIKWVARKTLWRNTYNEKYHKIWCSTYPELFPKLFFSSLLSFQEKIKVLLTYMNLYPHKSSRK